MNPVKSRETPSSPDISRGDPGVLAGSWRSTRPDARPTSSGPSEPPSEGPETHPFAGMGSLAAKEADLAQRDRLRRGPQPDPYSRAAVLAHVVGNRAHLLHGLERQAESGRMAIAAGVTPLTDAEQRSLEQLRERNLARQEATVERQRAEMAADVRHDIARSQEMGGVVVTGRGLLGGWESFTRRRDLHDDRSTR
jgi:hypothetical protein